MEEFKAEDTLGFLLSKAHQFMKSYFSNLIKTKNLDITVEQWGLLTILDSFPGISQTDIAGLTQTDKTNITRMLDLLEKKEYIERRKDENDRRLYRIHLTPAGAAILKTVIPIAQAVNQISCADFEPREIEILKEMLRRVRTNVEQTMRATP